MDDLAFHLMGGCLPARVGIGTSRAVGDYLTDCSPLH